jgi:GNAT superfamily N-acetyltransferase
MGQPDAPRISRFAAWFAADPWHYSRHEGSHHALNPPPPLHIAIEAAACPFCATPMPGNLTTRAFRAEDYDAVVQLWQQCEGVEVAEGDDRGGIEAYLERNSGLSRVALVDGRIVAAVLCGHDGRRGLIYHLAVARDLRGQGIGRTLLAECIGGLKAAGITRVLILVAKDNEPGQRFWVKEGFEDIPGAIPFGRDIA